MSEHLDRLEARTKTDPDNPEFRMNWVSERARWAKGDSRLSLAAWAIKELQELSGAFDGFLECRRLYWLGVFQTRLTQWEAAASTFWGWWQAGKENPDYWDANWSSLDEAASAFENVGDIQKAKDALCAWLAEAESRADEGWLDESPAVSQRLQRLP